jgi:hypothetical protein
MPRNRKPRKNYRPRGTSFTAHEVAMANVCKLVQGPVVDQVATLQLALHELQNGTPNANAWNCLADCANVAESLCQLRICSGDQAQALIADAQMRLSHIATLRHATGIWQASQVEVDVLAWLIALHERQLNECDRSEFERAYLATHTRIGQARAGNAPHGAIIVEGEIT